MRKEDGNASASRNSFVGALGHTSEDESGLIYMRARYYDPQVGRFISEDPACNGGNWFTYCSDSPVSCVDFTGMMTGSLAETGEVAEITASEGSSGSAIAAQSFAEAEINEATQTEIANIFRSLGADVEELPV